MGELALIRDCELLSSLPGLSGQGLAASQASSLAQKPLPLSVPGSPTWQTGWAGVWGGLAAFGKPCRGDLGRRQCW